MNLLRKILTTGRVTEPAVDRVAADEPVLPAAAPLRRSLQIRHVDAGSCNGCELEVVSTFGPSLAYDPATPLDGSNSSFVLIGAGALAALAAIALLYYRSRERAPAERRAITAELALGDRTS